MCFVLVGVFIHWEAKDDAKIQKFNYEATKLAIKRAVAGEPKVNEVLKKKGRGRASVRRIQVEAERVEFRVSDSEPRRSCRYIRGFAISKAGIYRLRERVPQYFYC